MPVASLFQQTIFCHEELKVSFLTIVGIDNDLLRKSYSVVYRKTKKNPYLIACYLFHLFLNSVELSLHYYQKRFGLFHCLIKYFKYAVDVVMNLQFVNFMFLIGHRLRVLNSELKSTITAICAYIIDCTSYTDGTYSVSVVVGFDVPVGRENMAAKIVPAINVTDTQIFTIHWLKLGLRKQRLRNIRTFRRIYLLLHSVIATVNNSFGVQMMLKIMSSATVTALNIHSPLSF